MISDIDIDIPLPILLAYAGAFYWPVTLAVAVVLGLLGAILPWLWARVVCFLLAAVLVADCGLGLWLTLD